MYVAIVEGYVAIADVVHDYCRGWDVHNYYGVYITIVKGAITIAEGVHYCCGGWGVTIVQRVTHCRKCT